MRILVTGASGFIGRHTAASLAVAGHEVVALGRHPAPGVATRPCDLLLPGAAEAEIEDLRPDMLIHLAWTTEHGRFWTDPANALWATRSVEIMRACVAAGTQRLVGVGTCYEYAFDDMPCDELRTPLSGTTPYGLAKNACRTALADLARQSGTSHAWARLFHLYGPHENPNRLVSSVCRALVAGTPAQTSSGRTWCDFMDARDAGAAIAALALSAIEGPVNVATGEPTQVVTVARMLAELAGRPDLLQVGALPDRAGEPARTTASVTRLNQEVGFRPGRSLQQGLGDALAFWRQTAPS